MTVEPSEPDAIQAHRMQQEREENRWRREAIDRLLSVFYALNGAVIAFILVVWIGEILSDRVPKMLSEKTLLALIAGSTAQLGALALFVGRSLVPTRRGGSKTADGEKG